MIEARKSQYLEFYSERKAAVAAFQTLAATAGAVFPALVPYTFAASAAAGVIEKLISVLEKDERVVKVPFSLYPGEPRMGMAPLQEGTYVTFAHPQDPTKFKLQSNGLLTTGDKPSDVSYAVFNITPQKQVSPNFVRSQKIATLLTQLNSGNPNSAKGTIEFLSATLEQYSNYKKLRRYLELKEQDSLSEQEKALMAEIAKIDELKPFLPQS